VDIIACRYKFAPAVFLVLKTPTVADLRFGRCLTLGHMRMFSWCAPLKIKFLPLTRPPIIKNASCTLILRLEAFFICQQKKTEIPPAARIKIFAYDGDFLYWKY